MNVPSESPEPALAPALVTPTGRTKRKRCDNCGAWLELTKVNKRFCNDACKNEFHRHGSAFGPLKNKLEKLVRKLVAEQVKTGWTTQIQTLKANGFLTAETLPDALAGKNAVIETMARQIKMLYTRIRVLEAAVANASPDKRPLAGISQARRTKKPMRAGSLPSPRRRKANARA